MDAPPCFVVTAWRNSRELLQLRQDIYSPETARRTRAVNKVFGWRLRKPDGLPLLLDSTADIVDVILQDERAELRHNALRLLYATAISRFVTGLADTQIDLTRDRPAWFPPGKSLQLPYDLLEVRHRIVHRHLPSLAELKRAAKDSLAWLWEWYWGQLDFAFPSVSGPNNATDLEPDHLVRETLQSILKTYVKARKVEIKSRQKDSTSGAETALSSYTLRYGSSSNSDASAVQARRILLTLLIDEEMILPTDKKLGSTMSGAFLLWDPFFSIFAPRILSLKTLLMHIIAAVNISKTSAMLVDPILDPVREGLSEWTLHLLDPQNQEAIRNLIEGILSTLFSEPSQWNVKIAEGILSKFPNVDQELWGAILDAARAESEDVDMQGTFKNVVVNQEGEKMENEGGNIKVKIMGPRKVIGLWKPKPWGWVEEGWEYDE